jgi:O-antigen/teichoic acid export membrane protein
MVIISVIFPKLVSSFENKEVFQQKKLTYYSFITIPSFLFCILVSLIASPLIHILYGAAFEHSATFLAKYNWVVLLLYFWWARMRISIIQQKIIDEIIVAVAALIIMILSLFLFSSYLGQYITIFSLLFSLISGNLIGAIFSNHIKESLKDFIFSFNVKQLLNPNF